MITKFTKTILIYFCSAVCDGESVEIYEDTFTTVYEKHQVEILDSQGETWEDATIFNNDTGLFDASPVIINSRTPDSTSKYSTSKDYVFKSIFITDFDSFQHLTIFSAVAAFWLFTAYDIQRTDQKSSFSCRSY